MICTLAVVSVLWFDPDSNRFGSTVKRSDTPCFVSDSYVAPSQDDAAIEKARIDAMRKAGKG